MLEDAVRDPQPAHIGVLRRRDVKQPVVAPAKIVRRFGRFILARLLFQPFIAVERMQFAFEFLLIRKLAARSQHAVLRAEWMASGPVGSSLGGRSRPPFRAQPAPH